MLGSCTPESVNHVESKCKLEISIRLLKDMQGTVLVPDENCPFDAEKLEEIPAELKGSMFWVEYVDHNEMMVKSVKKSYLKDFQITETDETKQTKTDFGLDLTIEE